MQKLIKFVQKLIKFVQKLSKKKHLKYIAQPKHILLLKFIKIHNILLPRSK